LLVLSSAFAAATLRAQWDVVDLDGRASVALDAIAKHYGMNAPSGAGPRQYLAEGGGRSFRVKVNSRDAIINGARQWLAFPVKENGGKVYVSRVDLDHTIDPAFRPGGVAGLRPVRTVVLDPGHGGHDKGATSRFGTEKEFALDVAARVRKRLEKAGFKVVQTRTSDSFIPLESRPAVANNYPASIFVSIHFNSAEWNPAANGIEIYSIPPRGAPPTGQGKPLARDLETEAGHALEPADSVLATTIFHSLLGGLGVNDRGIKRARFSVLRHARVPAVLIEGGFLTNASDAARIASSKWRDGYADAIARGIIEYNKLATQQLPPRTVAQYGGRATTEFVPED
jgi:N-acetylmuramoyl-L-alanine amidase